MPQDTRFEGPGPDEFWSRSLAEGRFVIQECRRCGAFRFPPALVCRGCGSPELAWVEPGGGGTVHSVTTVRERDGGYNVSLVDLDEGPRLMTCVTTIDPDRVMIGMRVRARIEPGETPRLVFVPAGENP